MKEKEFTGTENVQLVAGVLHGLRAFDIHYHSGGLTSPCRDYDWGNGEETASCWLNDNGHHHKIGALNCWCGFYSYHTIEHANTYYTSATYSVIGVIEAYGRVTVGYSGMRSEKARLVALVIPRSRFLRRPRAEHKKLLKLYPGVQTFGTAEEAARFYRINGRPEIAPK